MRVILDTNILISALIRRNSAPGEILEAWIEERYVLLTHALLLDEFRIVTRRRQIRHLIRPSEAGRLMNQIGAHAEMVRRLRSVQRSDDPADDFLLSLSETGGADYLVTGDKSGLLYLQRHGPTAIVTARAMLDILQ